MPKGHLELTVLRYRPAVLAIAVVALLAGCSSGKAGGKGNADQVALGETPSASASPQSTGASPTVAPRVRPSGRPATTFPREVGNLTVQSSFTRPPARPKGAPAQPPPTQHVQPPPPGQPAPQPADQIQQACYPPGVAGHDPGCTANTNAAAHWGAEPYFKSNKRYVWVVDELPADSRARAWLQFAINAFNSVVTEDHPDRPVFVYATAEQLGGGWSNCSHKLAQIVEVCAAPAGTRSYVQSTVDQATQHFTTASIHVDLALPAGYGDEWTENLVAHHFGHVLGLADDDTDCESVMSYCPTTLGKKYLWFGAAAAHVYEQHYDAHATN